jgi:hypothetical protein
MSRRRTPQPARISTSLSCHIRSELDELLDKREVAFARGEHGDVDRRLVPSARLALRRLAANADSRVDDSWPVVLGGLRLIRIELLDLSAWAHSRRLAPLS